MVVFGLLSCEVLLQLCNRPAPMYVSCLLPWTARDEYMNRWELEDTAKAGSWGLLQRLLNNKAAAQGCVHRVSCALWAQIAYDCEAWATNTCMPCNRAVTIEDVCARQRQANASASVVHSDSAGHEPSIAHRHRGMAFLYQPCHLQAKRGGRHAPQGAVHPKSMSDHVFCDGSQMQFPGLRSRCA